MIRLMCSRCAVVKIDRTPGGEQIRKVARSYDPIAHVVTAWRCAGCGLLNRRADPVQRSLFAGAL